MRAIKLMADYQCHPLWGLSPEEFGDIDPESLPISTGLKEALADWARTYDATLNMADPASSGFESEEARARFRQQGELLALQLKEELGPGFRIETMFIT